METSGIYWEMVGLYKDLFVEYYLDEKRDMLYQYCADGTCYALAKGNPEWKAAELPSDLQRVKRFDAERLEDDWNAD